MAQIIGTPRNANLVGTRVTNNPTGADAIVGLARADRIDGRSGNDRLFGGPGADRLLGNVGDDLLLGEDDDDLLRGGSGDDQLFGGNGRNLLLGDDGDDLPAGAGRAEVSRQVAAAARLPWGTRRAVSGRSEPRLATAVLSAGLGVWLVCFAHSGRAGHDLVEVALLLAGAVSIGELLRAWLDRLPRR